MSFLSSLSHWLVVTLEPYGAAGLMLIAVGDSSFLSLPEVNDAALMALSISKPASMWGLAAMTVLGSIIGCSLLYAVGRKGGEALLKKRFAEHTVARVRAWYDKYGMLAVIVPSLMPPPLPFKIFVLSAGAFRISWPRFVLSVAIGRSVRYFAEGLLAIWYGKQALQMVADNSARVGLILAGLIVVGALVIVYGRRRRVGSAALLCLLFMGLGSGCVHTTTTPENQRLKPSTPFTRAQALERLTQLSQSIQSLEAPIVLEGSIPEPDEKNQFRRKGISSLPGTLHIERPGRIYLQSGVIGQGFEMRSNGDQYEVYITTSKQVHVGFEEAPTAKSSCKVGPRAIQFASIKPRQIMEALVPDFRPLLDSTAVRTATYVEPVIKDQRRYYIVEFLNISSPPEARLLQRVWFDLSTPDVDIVRRQIFNEDGELERDTQYENPATVGRGSLRYPTRFTVHFVASDTRLTITMDPSNMTLNNPVDPDAFVLGTHRNAEVCKFELPAAVAGK